MQLNNKFSKQDEAPAQNLSKSKDGKTLVKKEQATKEGKPPLLNQKQLRKVWSLNLLRALSSGVVEGKSEFPISLTPKDISQNHSEDS